MINLTNLGEFRMGTKLQIEESVMAIVIYHHEILYIKELIYGMPKFSLPKGHIEDGETKIECAIRECYEETSEKHITCHAGRWKTAELEDTASGTAATSWWATAALWWTCEAQKRSKANRDDQV